jgi:molybdopterin-guanine dinucleotide biosynthesis protein A
METGEVATHAGALHPEAVTEALRGCIGVVLAGGRSSRMGRDKATLEIGGEPLLARVVGRLSEALPAVVVIGPAHLHDLAPGIPIIPDAYLGAGPLGGLVTALRAVPAPRVFLAGCDMPFVAPRLVRAMTLLAAEEPAASAVLLRSPAGLEYLHGIYARGCLPVAERMLIAGERSLRSLALVADVAGNVREVPAEVARRYDPSGLSAFNANTPEEWLRAKALVGET